MKSKKSTVFFLTLILLMAFLQSPLAIIPHARADTIIFYPEDDCRVDERKPDENGDSGGLAIGSIGLAGHPARYRFYMKFDLSSLAGKIITSAKFRLYVFASSGTKAFYIRKVSDDTWVEETITYNDKPAVGAVIFTGACGEAGGWVEHTHADITAYVDEEKGGLLSVWYGPIDTSSYEDEYNFYRNKEYDGGSVKPELVIEWEEPLSPVTNLFGAGFNGSTPIVDLYWNWNETDITLFEVQNSTDKFSWTYLGSNTTAEYHDFQVVNGTERYYRVRACNFTGAAWDNSTWSDINFEKVYYEIGGAPGPGPTPSLFPGLAIGIAILIIASAYIIEKRR